MTDYRKQAQTAGDNSSLIQAGGDVHVGLVTVSEVRQLALDVFKANALELAGVARDLFEIRGREFIDRYLGELQHRKPGCLGALEEPDMQYAVFTAQRDYARSGKASLEELLVNLLVERTAARDLRQIVLNEAIATAVKLTEEQLDTLSFILLFVHHAPVRYSFESMDDFSVHLKRYVAPLIHDQIAEPATYLHLKSAGCVSMDSGGISIIHRIATVFPGCFTFGFDCDQAIAEKDVLVDLLMPSFHFAEGWQFKPMDHETFSAECGSRLVLDSEIEKLEYLQQSRLLEATSVGECLSSLDSRFRKVSPWEPGGTLSPLSEVQLTTTGIALANANFRRKTGQEFDLGIWIK
jgi:hypothetical protein